MNGSTRGRGPSRGVAARSSAFFHALDRRLHIDHRGRSEWVWAVPIVTFAVSFALLVVAGLDSGIGPAVYIPVALVVAAVMCGLSISYMNPEPDTPDDGWGRRRAGEPAPAPRPLGWTRLRPRAPDPGGRRFEGRSAGPRKREGERSGNRERSGSR